MAHPSVPWQDEANSIATHKSNVYIDLSGWSPKYFPQSLVKHGQLGAAGQGALRHRLPADHPAEVAGRLRGPAAQGRGPAARSSRTTPSACSGWTAEDERRRRRQRRDHGRALYGVCDYYDAESLLTDAERGVLARLRTFLDEKVQPLLADYWERGEFPDQLARPLLDLDLMAPAELTDGPARKPVRALRGFPDLRARPDGRLVATFYNAQAGLFRTRHPGRQLRGAGGRAGCPKVLDFSLKGVFSLTEPESGSDIAGGLETSARRDGDDWVIDGAKRWIGGAATADVLAVFARDAGRRPGQGLPGGPRGRRRRRWRRSRARPRCG